MSIANEWNIKIGFSFILAMLAQNISIAIYLRLNIVALLGALLCDAGVHVLTLLLFKNHDNIFNKIIFDISNLILNTESSVKFICKVLNAL
jgi:hypothetical protein